MTAKQILSRATFIEIVGYTDDVGDDDYNLELSQQRAASVRDYLLSKGLDRNKIVTTDMGENMPVPATVNQKGVQKIVVLKFCC